MNLSKPDFDRIFFKSHEYFPKTFKRQSDKTFRIPIPYGLGEPDEKIDCYSHRDYSGLFFRTPPGEKGIFIAFNSILYDPMTDYIRFIDCLIKQAIPENKLIFLYWVLATMEKNQKRENSMLEGWSFKRHDKVVTSSVLRHVNSRLDILIHEDISFSTQYPYGGTTQKLVEIGLLILDGMKNKPKSDEAFVVWFCQKFGVDASGSYGQTKARIEKFEKVEDYESHKFAFKMWEKSVEKRRIADEKKENLRLVKRLKK